MTNFEDIARQRLSLDERPTEFDPTDEPLDPARGIIFGTLAGFGLIAAAYYAGLWRLCEWLLRMFL